MYLKLLIDRFHRRVTRTIEAVMVIHTWKTFSDKVLWGLFAFVLFLNFLI